MVYPAEPQPGIEVVELDGEEPDINLE